jgi:hypothetical protein
MEDEEWYDMPIPPEFAVLMILWAFIVVVLVSMSSVFLIQKLFEYLCSNLSCTTVL